MVSAAYSNGIGKRRALVDLVLCTSVQHLLSVRIVAIDRVRETMTASARRVGAETSKTRDALLDHVERMMLDDGYPSVTYRALASAAGVAPSLVQYYFPTLDDIFLAAIRRYSERNLRLLTTALESRSEDPLHALWEFSRGEATGA